MNIFDTFSKFSGLKPNKSKCEIAGIGTLKGVQVTLCDMRCIDLVSNIVKILGIYYSYNEKLEIQENFKRHIIKIERFLRTWRMKGLSIAGKITVFKTLAISKIVYLALVKTIPNLIIQKLSFHLQSILVNLYTNYLTALFKVLFSLSVDFSFTKISETNQIN